MKKIIILVILLVVILLTFGWYSKENKIQRDFKPLELEIGSEFTGLSYEHPMYVKNYIIKDITNDGKNDMIIVIGDETNMDVVVYDTSGECFIKGNLKSCQGNKPKLLTANLDDTPNEEMILLTENEDMTKNIKILSISNGECKEMMKPRESKGLSVTGYFMDGFKAYVSIRKLKLETYIDLKDYKDNYITAGFYDADGRVLGQNMNISATPFISVELVSLNDRYGIKTIQRIKGFDSLDILDEIEVVWKYENGNWNVKEAMGKKMGNLINKDVH